jgi:copper chaperone CopZ
LGSVPGIREATASTKTGSLLILYDPEVLALAENGTQLIRALVDILPGSFTETSVRFKLAAARHPELVGHLRGCLGREQGVEGIAADSSGQITVSYDPARLNIEQVIQKLIGMAHNQKRAPWRTPAARQAPLTHPSAGGP